MQGHHNRDVVTNITSASQLVSELQLAQAQHGVAVLDIYNAEWGHCKCLSETFRRLYTDSGNVMYLRFYSVECGAVLKSLAEPEPERKHLGSAHHTRNCCVDTTPAYWAEMVRSRQHHARPFFMFYKEGKMRGHMEGIDTPRMCKLVSGLCTAQAPAATFLANPSLRRFWEEHLPAEQSEVSREQFARAVNAAHLAAGAAAAYRDDEMSAITTAVAHASATVAGGAVFDAVPDAADTHVTATTAAAPLSDGQSPVADTAPLTAAGLQAWVGSVGTLNSAVAQLLDTRRRASQYEEEANTAARPPDTQHDDRDRRNQGKDTTAAAITPAERKRTASALSRRSSKSTRGSVADVTSQRTSVHEIHTTRHTSLSPPRIDAEEEQRASVDSQDSEAASAEASVVEHEEKAAMSSLHRLSSSSASASPSSSTAAAEMRRGSAALGQSEVHTSRRANRVLMEEGGATVGGEAALPMSPSHNEREEVHASSCAHVHESSLSNVRREARGSVDVRRASHSPSPLSSPHGVSNETAAANEPSDEGHEANEEETDELSPQQQQQTESVDAAQGEESSDSCVSEYAKMTPATSSAASRPDYHYSNSAAHETTEDELVHADDKDNQEDDDKEENVDDEEEHNVDHNHDKGDDDCYLETAAEDDEEVPHEQSIYDTLTSMPLRPPQSRVSAIRTYPTHEHRSVEEWVQTVMQPLLTQEGVTELTLKNYLLGQGASWEEVQLMCTIADSRILSDNLVYGKLALILLACGAQERARLLPGAATASSERTDDSSGFYEALCNDALMDRYPALGFVTLCLCASETEAGETFYYIPPTDAVTGLRERSPHETVVLSALAPLTTSAPACEVTSPSGALSGPASEVYTVVLSGLPKVIELTTSSEGSMNLENVNDGGVLLNQWYAKCEVEESTAMTLRLKFVDYVQEKAFSEASQVLVDLLLDDEDAMEKPHPTEAEEES